MKYYFTIHLADLRRGRILEGAHIMLVASAHWDADRRRFRIRRPPAGLIGGLAIDSG